MGLVGLMSRATGNLAGLAVGFERGWKLRSPRDGASVAVVADETPYRSSAYRSGSRQIRLRLKFSSRCIVYSWPWTSLKLLTTASGDCLIAYTCPCQIDPLN